jgi:uncharacterized protein (UPF0332 family)
MAYHDDLLSQAYKLVKDPDTQADLRRSVSTAYYALFHLLVSEAVSHWSLESSRGALARMFDHKLMKSASRQVADHKRYPGEDPTVVMKLRQVAESFVQLQTRRHIADYDNTVLWTQSEAWEEADRSLEAIGLWRSIRHEKIAQDYLVSLLIKPRD